MLRPQPPLRVGAPQVRRYGPHLLHVPLIHVEAVREDSQREIEGSARADVLHEGSREREGSVLFIQDELAFREEMIDTR